MIQKLRNQNKEMTDTVGLRSISATFARFRLDFSFDSMLRNKNSYVFIFF